MTLTQHRSLSFQLSGLLNATVMVFTSCCLISLRFFNSLAFGSSSHFTSISLISRLMWIYNGSLHNIGSKDASLWQRTIFARLERNQTEMRETGVEDVRW